MSIFRPRQFPCNIGRAPVEDQGARYVPIALPFTVSVLTFTDDLVLEAEQNMINNVQSLYIDNSISDGQFSITFLESGMNVTIAAHTQGWFPILCHQQVGYTATASNGTVYGTVKIFFLNVPIFG